MSKRSGLYPRVQVDTSACAAVGQAGGVLLVETIRTSGIDAEMSAALRRWRKPLAVHDPGKIVLDLAMSLAVGGDCLADVNLLRAEPAVYGSVASDPTVSRLVDTSPMTPTTRWPRSRPPALRPGRGCGRWPVTVHPTTPAQLRRRW